MRSMGIDIRKNKNDRLLWEVWQAGDDLLVTTKSEVLLVVATCIHSFSGEENPSVSKEASSSETLTPKE